MAAAKKKAKNGAQGRADEGRRPEGPDGQTIHREAEDLSVRRGAAEDPALLQVRRGEYSHGDTFIGVRMGQVFALAKAFVEMIPAEIEKLMTVDIHEARAGAIASWASRPC